MTEIGNQRSEVREQTTADKDRAFYLEMLKSEQCLCERGKKPGKAFCYGCYKRLPYRMQEDLYKRVGQGFEEAYEAATKYLQENIW